MNKQEWISNYFKEQGWKRTTDIHWQLAEEAYYTTTYKELKPCPFCGTKAKLKRVSLSEIHAYADEVTIYCAGCGISMVRMGDTSKGGYANNTKVVQKAIDAWNRRA